MFGELRDNGQNWAVKSFSEFAMFDTNMISDFSGIENMPHIGIDSIEKDTGQLSGYRTIEEDKIRSGKYYFTNKHIIYSKIRPNLNKVALPDFEGVCSTDAYPILVHSDIANRIFLAYILRSSLFLDFILSFSKRTNLPKVNKSQISKFSLPLPPLPLQEEFARFVEAVDKSKFVCQKWQELVEKLLKIQYNKVN